MATPPGTDRIHPLQPIFTAHLFPKVDGMLLELLRSLSPEDWEKQTVSPKWKVKDVAAHLLDTLLRGLSVARTCRGQWIGRAAEYPEDAPRRPLPSTWVRRFASPSLRVRASAIVRAADHRPSEKGAR